MGKKSLGIMLVILGVLLLLGNLGYLPGNLFLLIVGGGFLYFYVRSGVSASERNLGLLIPGLIIVMVWLYGFLNNTLMITGVEGYLFFILLGLAFLGIYLIHTMHVREASGGEKLWPLYPALALVGFGVLIRLEQQLESEIVRMLMNNLFPIALIIVGLIIVVRTMGKRK